jgi:hypothetical protein
MAERDLLGGRRSRVAEIIDDVRSEASEEEIVSKPQTPATVDKKGKGKAAADEEEELLRVESEDSNEEDEDEEIGEDEFVLAPYTWRQDIGLQWVCRYVVEAITDHVIDEDVRAQPSASPRARC